MDEEFEILKKVIIEKIGFFPERYKERPLMRRIAVRMRHIKINSYLEYARLLERNIKEQDLLHKTLTINVSKFFRNYVTFRRIKEAVLPQLLREKEKRGGIIKIWCGGCATGEECYTIAMLLDEFLREKKSSVVFSVIGTDIDEDSLNTAQIGCYENKAFDETPEYFLKKYFKKDEKFCVLKKIKEKVKFVKLDIEEENMYLKELDLILFRNVLIYMKRTFQEKILLKIYNRLNERGFLVLGKVETLVGETKLLFTIVDSKERIFRKCRILKR